ncbi:NADP-dependent oxidoreductase domain-containing protein [Boletus reticuloceps]|uniref:NADP-dependent oxidoreductase domain-containing protein n=1 Tax=Boletus reticuloceps TaxID=495285 RepID=A0A8I2YFB1_9AGAM|nr:NADP-dependent oxidoreductase domain-containing protein [Boletus reticuloceps]
MYAEGTTEQILSELNLKCATIDTKVYPVKPGDHSPVNLRNTFLTSLQHLKRDKIRILYLHAPDRSVPFEDTLREVNNLYKEGKIEIFGLSNFAAWEVAEVVGICTARGYVLPKIYQAMYNAITREIETELVPCCRKYGIRLVIYNPLAAHTVNGRDCSAVVSSRAIDQASDGRFDPSSNMGKMYRARYLREGYFNALELLKDVAVCHSCVLV